jgi:hypothetical protein
LQSDPETQSKDAYSSLDPEVTAFQEALYKEVVAEVQRRRKEGAYPPAFELAMDKAFKRHAPNPGEASVYSSEHLLDMVEATGFIDVMVPTKSSAPGVSYIKWTIKKLTAWYFNYVAQQISNFVVNLVHLLRVIHVRLDKLERRVYELYPEVLAADLPPSLGLSIAESQSITKALSEVKGRVLVTECASGDALKVASELGCDVYGIDHREHLLKDADQKADIRWETLGHHIRSLAPESLGAVVVQGSYELRSSHDKTDIIGTLYNSLTPTGGLFVLLFHSPEVAGKSREITVATELAPGRLFSDTTWIYALEHIGFSVLDTGEIAPLTKEGVPGRYVVATKEA